MQANDPQIPIPNLDQLISEGVSLRSYYTLPVCSPTRTSILSGRYPMHVGTQHQVLWAGQRAGLPLKDKTIADRLSARGYTCHAIGKWHTRFYSWEHTPIGTTPHTRTNSRFGGSSVSASHDAILDKQPHCADDGDTLSVII
jgi:arylsulfatase A-like enzyme